MDYKFYFLISANSHRSTTVAPGHACDDADRARGDDEAVASSSGNYDNPGIADGYGDNHSDDGDRDRDSDRDDDDNGDGVVDEYCCANIHVCEGEGESEDEGEGEGQSEGESDDDDHDNADGDICLGSDCLPVQDRTSIFCSQVITC